MFVFREKYLCVQWLLKEPCINDGMTYIVVVSTVFVLVPYLLEDG
jgi:hypothetical protein